MLIIKEERPMKTTDRVLSFLLALVMVFSLLSPSLAYAEAPEGTIALVEDPAPAPEDPAETEEELTPDAQAEDPASVPIPDRPQDAAHSFLTQPESGDADPDDGYTISWETSFTPERVVIVKKKLSSYTYSEHAVVKAPYSNSMTYTFTYGEASSDYNYLVYAYYDTGYVYSQEFRVYNTPRKFTASPAGGTVEPGGQINLEWTTNFTPRRIQLRYWNRGESDTSARTVSDFQYPYYVLRKTMNVPFSYDILASSPHWVVAAYYGSGEYDYVTSKEFSIQLTGRGFTTPPADCSVEPDGVVPIQWSTNFVPTKIQIGYTTGASNFYPKLTITSGLSATMGQFLDYNTVASGSSTWCVAAYYEENKVEFSPDFTISRTPRSFTEIPSDRELSPGESTVLSWKTNFIPTKIELCTYHSFGDSTVSRVTLTENLSTSMSYELDYKQLPASYNVSDIWLIRAYHGGGGILPYVASEQFVVKRISPKVLSTPDEFRISRGGSALLSWETNFVPVKVEIKAKYWSDDYQVVKTITTGLGKRMTNFLSASEISSGINTATSLLIYAYYDYSTPVTSGSDIPVTWLSADKCGDHLTWDLDEDGTLTISGTGPMWDFDQASKPWHSQRSAIKKVVIADGVTYIGKYAFYFCNNITDVSIPTSVTEIGKGAFLLCMNLRYVYYDGFFAQAQQIVIRNENTELSNAYSRYLFRSGSLDGGNVFWTVDGEFGVLTISGTGGSGIHVTAPWQEWSQWITGIEIQEGIDTVWEDAFRDCSNVVVVGLPISLKLVESGAFSACTELSDVYYNGPSSDWTKLRYNIQSYNDPLLEATIHTSQYYGQLTDDLAWTLDDNGLLRIFVDPALNGSGVQTDIPDYEKATVTPWYTTNHASAVNAVRLERGVTGIGNYAFSSLPRMQTVEIADTVTFIGNYAFDSGYGLKEVFIPYGVASIGVGAFRNCSGLEQILLPDSIETLGVQAFRSCSNLKKVWLPGQLAAVPNSCFENCKKLQMVNIPVTVTSVGESAFNSCSALLAEGGEVYYGGSSAQYVAISGIGRQSYLLKAWTVHFVPEELAVNARNFPDPAFLAYVSETIDTDSSGWLTDAEIAAVTEISMDSFENLQSVQGIEYFTALTRLELTNNPNLTAVDLSANTELTYLDLGDNKLESLDLTGLSHLTQLFVNDNKLNYLDVAGLPLTVLDCHANPLTALVLSDHPDLKRLYCNQTSIKVLDIRYCPYLLDAYENGTISEESTGTRYLGSLGGDLFVTVFDYTEILTPDCISVDPSHFPDPAFLSYVAQNFDTNLTQWLTPKEIQAAKEINCSGLSALESLQGIEYFNELETLNCSRCGLHGLLDLSANWKLRSVNCGDNSGLDDLNLIGLTALEELRCTNCSNLSDPDLSSNGALRLLYLANCQLSNLDLSQNPQLMDLDVSDNYFTSLDLSQNRELLSLTCYSCEITALDLTANTKLKYLDCDGMESLQSLNVSGLTRLEHLVVSDCGLTALDVSDCALIVLECDHNPLETLILGEQADLESLYCYAVELQELDLRGCPILEDAWVNGTHTAYDWGQEVYNGDGLGGYMELDKDLAVLANGQTGDVNCDGRVTALDLIQMRKYLVGLETDHSFSLTAANLNGDETVNILDLVRLRKILAP